MPKCSVRVLVIEGRANPSVKPQTSPQSTDLLSQIPELLVGLLELPVSLFLSDDEAGDEFFQFIIGHFGLSKEEGTFLSHNELFEGFFWRPAKIVVDFAGFDGVALIVARAVGDEGDEDDGDFVAEIAYRFHVVGQIDLLWHIANGALQVFGCVRRWLGHRLLAALLGFEQAENQILRGGFASGGDPLKLQTRFWLVQIGE